MEQTWTVAHLVQSRLVGGTDVRATALCYTRRVDKKALLSELTIDREAREATGGGRPIKWFAAIAVAAGIAFTVFYVDFPIAAAPPTVRTVVAQAGSPPAGDSVLDATGYVVARRQATVSAKVTGKVQEVLIEEGMTVTPGQLLAQLDDAIHRAQLELAESQHRAAVAALDETGVQLKQAKLDLNRTRELAERQLASQADLDRDALAVEALQARIARAQQELGVAERAMDVQRQRLQDMQIRAPFGGVVIAKAAQPGEMISPVSAGGGFTRTGICTIVDMESLEVEVDVNEAYINRVYGDQPATITLNAYPDVRMPARVIAIIPTADRNKATVRVRIGFVERDSRVLPDMGVKVAFLESKAARRAVAPSGVVVPGTAVADEGQGAYVWVVQDERVARREIALGEGQGTRRMVLAGLDGGERVVASAADMAAAGLADGDRVRLTD